MSRQPDPARKPALLDQIIDYLLDKPLSSLSLRPLAKALDVSTFTLVYHFGSHGELVSEIVRAISRRANVIAEELRGPVTIDSYIWGLETSWQWAVQERSILLLRLEFEAALLEAHDRGHSYTREIHRNWQRIGCDALVELGLPRPVAEAEARVAVDTMFGLQYDLVVNRDVEGATRAFRHMVDESRARIEGMLARS